MEDQSLVSFIELVCGDSHLRVEKDLGDGFVRLRSSEAERRQAAQDIRSSEDVVIELLRNARDAGSSLIWVALSREGHRRFITVIDNGCGIPMAHHETVFEPRVTSKLDSASMDKWGIHGRGMALFSIAENAHKAWINVSEPKRGTALSVITNLEKLPEKTDQSTFPLFELNDQGIYSMRGPKNLIRTIAEFALECRDSCAVYCGSPVEIAATLYGLATAAIPIHERVFDHDRTCYPLAYGLAFASDATTFAQGACALGLDLSERSARRVLDGEITPLPTVLSRIEEVLANTKASLSSDTSESRQRRNQAHRSGKKLLSSYRPRRLHFNDRDKALLSESLATGLDALGKQYYFRTLGLPTIKTEPGRIVIEVPIESED